MSRMWKYLIAILFALHGLIHALGFAATWQIGPISAVSSTPSLIADLSMGGAAVRVLGVRSLASLIGVDSSFRSWISRQLRLVEARRHSRRSAFTRAVSRMVD